VGGLCWNPRAWIACAVTFYGIFAFFFTTVFTNPTGIVSGAVGSLGYWLEQQGVRRGSQPQYYYLMIQMPIYEFLPMIGATFAGVLGLLRLFRFRAERFTQTRVERVTANAPVEGATDEEAEEVRSARLATMRANRLNIEALNDFPMIGFLGFWAVMIAYALTLSGEKMPWLTTHITLPMCFVTGWFLGKIMERVDWPAFFKRSWYVILLTPLLLIGIANLIGPLAFGQIQLTDMSLLRDNLLVLGSWLFALMITGATIYALWLIVRRVGLRETMRVIMLGVFVLLGVLTARAAWGFTFIRYDEATEFGVYAHGAPAMKTVMNRLEELSKSTTDSLAIKVAYDNDVSWPGSWYFRNYTQARFLGDPTSGVADLDQNAAVLVSFSHRGAVEPSLGENYYKYEFIRMWWPMQDYFDLNANRVNNVLMPVDNGVDPGKLRQGLWDIWWNRDYKQYGVATSKNFEINQWPVADRMVFFVRKDIAAQIWPLGVGNVSPVTVASDPFTKLRCNECRADIAIGSAGAEAGQLNNPHGARIGADGNLYVADTRNGRIVVFDANGQPLRTIGVASTNDQTNSIAEAGTLREPWGVAVGRDGTVAVADTWNHRVQVFNAQGQLVRAFGRYEQVKPGDAGSADGFWGPRDIAIDASGSIYVADTGNKRIRVYDVNGTLIRSIGTPGAGAGQLNEPVGLAIDSNAGRIYVADSWNKRIQVFTTDGSPITSWKVPTWYGPSDDTGNRPYLAVDAAGQRLYAAEPDTGRILVWDLSQVTAQGGEIALLTFGSKGAADMNRFGAVGGVAVDNTALYVVDAQNSRVLKFALDKLPGLRPLVPVNNVQPTTVPVDGQASPIQPATVEAQPTEIPPTAFPTNAAVTPILP
jgi:DNA-binding beta-propeller fold protein YncE